jgi:cell division protein FtsQ
MKSKGKIKRIAIVAGWGLFTLALITLLGFVSKKQHELRCTAVEVTMREDLGHEFVLESDVLKLANSKGNLVGKSVGNINTALLEKIILSNPYVEDVEVYSAIGGKVHIDLKQRNPIVRIINRNDEQFYIDRTGAFMPLSETYTSPVVVASGYIFNTYAEMKVGYNFHQADSLLRPLSRTIDQVYTLASFIQADTFWSGNAEQIYVNEFQELELIPRVGHHRILLGDTTDLSKKFRNLMVFYRDGLNKIGWNNYHLINLKYKDQVVCSKTKF